LAIARSSQRWSGKERLDTRAELLVLIALLAERRDLTGGNPDLNDLLIEPPAAP